MTRSNITEIIEGFASCSFDDLGGSKTYARNLFKSWEEPQISSNEKCEIIKQELETFLQKIGEHESKEFMALREQFDYKYGHWNVLRWIISRWFMDTRNIEDVPKLYQAIISITNDSTQPSRQTKDVVLKLLESINKMNQKERKLIAYLLGLAAQEFSNHACNDVPQSVFKDWSSEELDSLMNDYRKWDNSDNDNSDNNDNNNKQINDWSLMELMAHKLSQ